MGLRLQRFAFSIKMGSNGQKWSKMAKSGQKWPFFVRIPKQFFQIQKEDGRDFTVIGTGGVASLFAGASETIQHYDSQLTIDGLYEVWRLNRDAA